MHAFALKLGLAAELEMVSASLVQNLLRALADVDAVGLRGGLHATGRVHRVAEETVARHFQTDHAGDARARMHANAETQRHARQMLYGE